MIVLNGGPGVEVSEAVLFPYDDRTIPFRYRLQIGLVEGVNPYKGHLVAMERGGPGTPDSRVVKYYGAVCQVEDELRLWYLGHGDIDGKPTPAQVCYAVSTDGVNWEKPELGLVEFNGSKRNNLLPFEAPGTPASCSVLYDPEDPDPARRFKMVTEDNPYYITASYSHDGIHWKEGPNNPILKHNAVEPTGLIRFNGCYLLNGQGGNVGTKRALVTFVSWDFDNWSDAVVLGLRRDRHPVCIGQKQRWFLLRLLSDDSAIRIDAHPKPEFDRWRWVDYWEPAREVVFFKRFVYRRALAELAPILGVAARPTDGHPPHSRRRSGQRWPRMSRSS